MRRSTTISLLLIVTSCTIYCQSGLDTVVSTLDSIMPSTINIILPEDKPSKSVFLENYAIIVTLLIAFLSSGITYFIASRSQKNYLTRLSADNISNKRQLWIDSIREEFSVFLSLSDSGIKFYKKQGMVDNDLKEQIKESYYKVKLSLNPNEDLSKHIIHNMDDIIDRVWGDVAEIDSESSYEISKKNLVDHVQDLLKQEWEKIKENN